MFSKGFTEQSFRLFDQDSDGKIEFIELEIANGVAGKKIVVNKMNVVL